MVKKLNGFEAIRIKIEEDKTKLEDELEALKPTGDAVEFGDDEDENATEVAIQGDRSAVAEQLEKALKDANKALDRIEDGTYGICKYCNEPIEEGRLQIRPTSSSCVKCKKQLQQEI